MKDCFLVALIGVFVLLVLGLLTTCASKINFDQQSRNSKCFEQTQDKQCWGIK